MENDTEVIRQQMVDTRTALSEKVEAVEEMVKSTVKETTQAVAQTVENVTNTVENTVQSVSDSVQSVKDALDVSAFVDKYPWGSMAGSVALGYAVGCLLSQSNGHHQARHAGTPPSPSPASESKSSSMFGSFLPDGWEKMLDNFKGLAVGTAAGVVGEILMNAMPDSLKENVSKLIDEATESLGGTVLRREHTPQAANR